VIAQRVLAIAAAVFFVAAVAVATFGAQSMSLGEALFMLDGDTTNKALTWTSRIFGHWVWSSVVQPLLVRPAWLIPASAGIVCTGLSMSLFNRKSPHRSHRRS
jgi:hypothetical protein